jgi:Na+-driven multidrug efflux pump
MSLLVLLLILVLVFGVGGGTYSRWGAAGPAWGGTVMYTVAVIMLVVLLVSFFAPGRFAL